MIMEVLKLMLVTRHCYELQAFMSLSEGVFEVNGDHIEHSLGNQVIQGQ